MMALILRQHLLLFMFYMISVTPCASYSIVLFDILYSKLTSSRYHSEICNHEILFSDNENGEDKEVIFTWLQNELQKIDIPQNRYVQIIIFI